MKDFSKGKIFLSSERGVTETDWFRSCSTFNFGNYQNEHKSPIGPFYVLNDETLAGGKQVNYHVDQNSIIVLLPLVGAITLTPGEIIQAGEILALHEKENSNFQIGNPYDSQLVNFLQLRFWYPPMKNLSSLCSFDLEKNRNRLLKIFDSNIKLSIGKFDGRSEGIYSPDCANSIFVFVIQGAFEVQNRLLETRDGLSLENVKEIQMEALSNDAILLLAEIPPSF